MGLRRIDWSAVADVVGLKVSPMGNPPRIAYGDGQEAAIATYESPAGDGPREVAIVGEYPIGHRFKDIEGRSYAVERYADGHSIATEVACKSPFDGLDAEVASARRRAEAEAFRAAAERFGEESCREAGLLPPLPPPPAAGSEGT